MNKNLKRAQKLLNQSTSDTDKIISLLKKSLQQDRSSWMAYHFMGMAYIKKREYEEAISFFERAIQKGANDPGTFYFLSRSYFQIEKYNKSELNARQAVGIKEDYFEGWMQLGAASRSQGKLNEALNCYQKANQIDPKNAEVAFRIASIYRDQSKHEKALELFDIAIRIDQNYLEAYTEKANILRMQKKIDEADSTLRQALKINNNFIKAKAELAELYKIKGDYERAIEIYEELLESHPTVTGLRVNYALCQLEIGHFEESEKNYLHAFKENPEIIEALSNYLMGLHYNPARTKEEIFEAHLLWDKQYSRKPKPERPIPQNIKRGKKLRVGLLSGGLRTHPVGWMITLGLENLPKDQFEIFCYSTNSTIDFITKRIYDRSDAWRPVTGYSEEVIAGMIRDDEIDILVELSGHSADNRLRTVNLEPAPVIVKWVGGLFNTTGLESVDFLITDWNETPEGEEEFYTEKLVRMPDDYICFLAPEYAPDVENLPALENETITFGCFNNPTKINNEILEKWAEILNRVPKSRLFLKSRQYDTKALRTRIIEKMAECGVSKDRLIFEGASPHEELLRCYNRVDIALDPWPYSGGLTTCEALWMGVPVITKPGPTFAGRHSATHLINAGFPGWVADKWEEYVNEAVSLANDIERSSELRIGLRERVAQSPLCDGEKFGANLALAFREMWKQRVQGYEENLEEGKWQDHIEIHDTTETARETALKSADGAWKLYLKTLPWAQPLMDNWEKKSVLPEHERYFQALNNVCTAVSLANENKKESKGESRQTELLVLAAEILIELFNKGIDRIPVIFTLARTLGLLGKRDESAEVIKTLMESKLLGEKELTPDLPFLLPLPVQDSTSIHTDIKNWLTVRTAEAWILFKDSSTWFSDEHSQSLLRGLMDNPETLTELNEIVRKVFEPERNNRNGIRKSGKYGKFLHFCFNHVYAKSLSDLIEYINQHSGQEHWLYIEKRNAIHGYSADIRGNRYSTFFDFNEHLDTVINRCREYEVDGIFVHGLFFNWQKELISQIAGEKHIGWIIWGGDLYNPINDDAPIYDTIQHIDSIHSLVEGDVKVFDKIYGARESYRFGYPYPALYGDLPQVSEKSGRPQIIVGNSGDVSNNHIEILKALTGKEDIMDYDLILPVSYNFIPDYEKELKEWISESNLAENTRLENAFLSPADYFNLMGQSHMLITAHHRQQAIGNLLTSLYNGNITVLRQKIKVEGEELTNPTWEFLKRHNLRVNSFEQLTEVKALAEINGVSGIQQDKHQKIIKDDFGLELRAGELVDSCEKILQEEKVYE